MAKKIFFLFLFCVLIYSLHGTPLDQLPELVETRSKELKARRLEIAAQRLDIKNQPYTYLPDLSLSYKGDFNQPFFDDFSHTHTFTLSSGLTFSDNQVFSDRIEVLEYQKLLIEYDQYYQKLLYEAIELYIDALKKKVVYELAQANESVSALNYEFAQSKNRQGTLSDIELLNAEADYDNSLYLSRKGKLDYDMALSSLRRKLNSPDLTIEDISPGDPAYISIEEITGNRIAEPQADESPLVSGSLKSDEPQVSGAQHSLSPNCSLNEGGQHRSPYNICIQEKQLKILGLKKIISLRNRWFPQLSLGLSLRYAHYEYNSKADEQTGLELKFIPGLGITASIPLFSNNEKTLAVKKSTLAIQKAQMDLDEMRSQFEEEILELVELHNRSIDLLKISRKRVESARREYDKKNESFKLGITTVLELYDTRDRYMEREKDALYFTLDIVLLRARIGNAVGETFLFLGPV